MAREWKAGDYIPIDYINALEKEVEELRKKQGQEKVSKEEEKKK